MIAFVGTTNLIRLLRLRFLESEAYVNDAIVTVTVTDTDGDEIGGVSWPMSMSYNGEEDGTYEAELPADAPLVAGTCYIAEIVAVTTTAVPEKQLTKKLRFTAKEDIS